MDNIKGFAGEQPDRHNSMTIYLRSWWGRWILPILFLFLAGCGALNMGVFPAIVSGVAGETRSTEMRGVWVQDRSVTTAENIDKVLERVRAGGFNAVFVNVFSDGETLYPSSLTRQAVKVEQGFDPLSYLVTEAHRYNIKVHAWFLAGRVSDPEGYSPILAQHPDWSLVGPDGTTKPWLNFAMPEVRQFISDLMWETVENHNVDGLHFDYTRYPGPEWGFDPYSQQAFSKKYKLDLDQMRYLDLPAYGSYQGNPLAVPGSAQVLAEFVNGLPAVALNRYGEGEVLLLNWDVVERKVGVGTTIVQRALGLWLKPGEPVYVLRSATTGRVYSYGNFDEAMDWLAELGWEPLSVEEMSLEHLESGSVLVLPNVYLISPHVADELEGFVQRGGRIIFFDGPTLSIKVEKLQAITGMQGRGSYYSGMTLMTANQEHPLIPMSDRSSSLEEYQTQDALFKEFRKEAINQLIRDINRRVKRTYPNVDISVTITSDQIEATQRYLQDWPAWLEGGYIDFLVPRAYVQRTPELLPVINAWHPFMDGSNQVTLGLKTYVELEDSEVIKTPEQLVSEIWMARKAGSSGIMIFDLDRMSDEQLEALAAGPFSTQP